MIGTGDGRPGLVVSRYEVALCMCWPDQHVCRLLSTDVEDRCKCCCALPKAAFATGSRPFPIAPLTDVQPSPRSAEQNGTKSAFESAQVLGQARIAATNRTTAGISCKRKGSTAAASGSFRRPSRVSRERRRLPTTYVSKHQTSESEVLSYRSELDAGSA